MTVHPRVLVSYEPSPEERDAFGETLAGLATIGYLPQVVAGDRAGAGVAAYLRDHHGLAPSRSGVPPRTWPGACAASLRGTSSTAPNTSPHPGDGTRTDP